MSRELHHDAHSAFQIVENVLNENILHLHTNAMKYLELRYLI